ncbi:MAG: hypothetical protein D3X82_01985 [Candidatus Leucobacter sulfamidivorax]|nr:hypothetical protein [Candidatus Leucobacter sulfamidivorax]
MSAATLVLTYIDVTGLSFSGDAAFGAGLGQFVTEIELGRLWLLQLMLAAMTTVLCFAVRDRRWVLLALVGEMLLIETARVDRVRPARRSSRGRVDGLVRSCRGC